MCERLAGAIELPPKDQCNDGGDAEDDGKHRQFIVHLGGHMDRLETELDGFGGSTGAALPGEIWTVPAERKYASHACGKTIEYAVLRLRPEAKDIVEGASDGRRDINPVAGVRDEFLHQTVCWLLGAMRAGDDVSAMLAESLSQSISLHILHSLSPGGSIGGVGKDNGPILNERTARTLRDHIHGRLDQRITLDELSQHAGAIHHPAAYPPCATPAAEHAQGHHHHRARIRLLQPQPPDGVLRKKCRLPSEHLPIDCKALSNSRAGKVMPHTCFRHPVPCMVPEKPA